MKLSCCAYSYRNALRDGAMTLFDFLRTCREIGCAGVELTAYYFPDTERGTLNDLKRAAHREGVAISGTAVGSDFAHPDAAKRAEFLAMTRAWIEHSVVLGAPTMRVFAGGIREGQTEAEAFQNVVSALQECAEIAWNAGVTLALENHGGLTETAEGTLQILKAVNHPGLGLNLDFGNFRTDVYTQFAACAPYAVATHAKAVIHNPGASVLEPVDYARVRQIMDSVGYRGYLAIEYEEQEPAEVAVPRFAAQLLTHLA
ncbi:MAG TPA: sugar phosphate isomerase/epimerase family protein [Chthonomonadaceae bacterium]|nr:sugar phosphate isomerase/epimerase family protein [Chthonomonadaceae bacterium]